MKHGHQQDPQPERSNTPPPLGAVYESPQIL